MAEEDSCIFLTLVEIMDIHRDQIGRYGGIPGLRDEALLNAAYTMPMSSFSGNYLHLCTPSKAAAYMYHIAMNHPFFDGNKRVATVASLVFLEMNDHELDVGDDQLEEVIFKLARGELTKDDLIGFFKENTRKIGLE